MRILDWNLLDESARHAALARPALSSRADVGRVAREVIEEVRRHGDAAVRGFTEAFDGVHLESFAVTADEFAAARRALKVRQIASLERAIVNVRRFHEAQIPRPLAIETEAGVHCELITRPISRVGLYEPCWNRLYTGTPVSGSRVEATFAPSVTIPW